MSAMENILAGRAIKFSKRATAICDYDVGPRPRNEFLHFRQKEILEINFNSTRGWWHAQTNTGEMGWIPSHHVVVSLSIS